MKMITYLKKYFWDIFSIAFFVLVFSVLLFKIPFHPPKFSPLEKAFKSFELSDIWFSKIKQRNSVLNDPYIRIVDVANLDRGQIGKLINKLNRFNPKVIGLNVEFIGRKDPDNDSILIEAIQNSENIVLSQSFEIDDNQRSLAIPLNGKVEGHNNLIARYNTTVRAFSPVEIINGKEQFAFASLVAKAFDKEAFNELQSRNNKKEIINYSGNKDQFTTFKPYDVDSSDITGNIVLIGFCCAGCKVPIVEDLHFTPLNPLYSGKSIPDMYGVVIHANIVAMILNSQYINDAPFWVIIIIAFSVLFLYIKFVTPWFIVRSKHTWSHIVAKITQVALSMIFLFIEFILLSKFHLKIDMGLIILAIALSIDFIGFYEFFIRVLKIEKSVYF